MRRRTAIASFVATAGLFLGGHTPYGQWVAYRQKHLLIGAHRGDLAGYEAAKTLANHLAIHLPSSRARVARAKAPSRLASLLATGQLDVALLDPKTIRDMRQATGKFAAYGEIPLQLLLSIGDWSLVAAAGFPSAHAWLVAATLDELRAPQDPLGLPIHAGAAAFRQGAPKPA